MTTLRSHADGRRLAARTAMLAVTFAFVAPFSAGAQSVPTSPASDSNAKVPAATVRVDSNNWLDVHLYLVRDGEPFSLGVVAGPGKAELKLPSLATVSGNNVQILVLPIGGTVDYLSPVLNINPGDVVELTIQNDLSLSSAVVLPGR